MRRSRSITDRWPPSAALAAAGVQRHPAAGATPKTPDPPHRSPRWVANAHSTGNAPAKATLDLPGLPGTQRWPDRPQGGRRQGLGPRQQRATGKFLSAKQFHAKYDATAASSAKVASWLRANDLKVTSVEAHRRYLVGRAAPTAAVEKAFSISIADVPPLRQERAGQHRAGRRTSRDRAADHDRHGPRHDTPPHPAPVDPAGAAAGRVPQRPPVLDLYGQVAASKKADFKTPFPKFKGKTLPYSVCGYTGPQYRAAYQGKNPAGLDGKGDDGCDHGRLCRIDDRRGRAEVRHQPR